MTEAASAGRSTAGAWWGRLDRVARDRAIIVVAYTLAWGLVLINRGLYWDDWTLVGVSPASLVNGYGELGMPWIPAVYVPLLGLPLPGLIGHVLVFAFYLAGALVLHAIVLRLPGMSRLDALVVALVFAVFPVNYARVALIDLPYALSLLFFLSATWLLLRHVESGGAIRRGLALLLFLASFSTASLLLLYAVPIALAAYVGRQRVGVSWRALVTRYVDFLLLPVLFWIVKSIFFKPNGVYEGYNALTLRGLVAAFRDLLAIPGQVLVVPTQRAVLVGGLVGLVFGLLVAAWLVRRTRAEAGARRAAPAGQPADADGGDPEAPVPTMVVAVAGVALIGLGVLGYLAVGKIPTIWDWSSRHQLLVPLGTGLLAAACVRLAAVAGRAGFVFAGAIGLLIGVFIVADARTLVAYQADWFKQVALMEAARDLPSTRTAHHIVVTDEARRLDALRRTYRFYEYNALFEQALGGTDRLVSGDPDVPAVGDLDRYVSRPAYHMDDYAAAPVDLELHVGLGPQHAGTLETLRLALLEVFDPTTFRAEVSRIIDVTASAPTGEAAGP